MNRLKNYNLIVFCSFLAGIPGETLEDIKDTVCLLLKMQKVNPKFRNQPIYLYTPYPGTKMYELVISKGFKAPAALHEWADCEWDSVTYGGSDSFYSSLHFASLFLDRKTREYTVPFVIRILADLYRPLAKLRIKNLYFGLMIEKYFFEVIKNYWYSRKLKNENSFN